MKVKRFQSKNEALGTADCIDHRCTAVRLEGAPKGIKINEWVLIRLSGYEDVGDEIIPVNPITYFYLEDRSWGLPREKQRS